MERYRLSIFNGLQASSLMAVVLGLGGLGFGGLGMLAGCNGIQSNQDDLPGGKVYREDLKTESGEPAYITVQHCLISFRGTATKATRSIQEAESLAKDLFEKVQAGADFEEIIRKYTDDSPPGIYRMANKGFPSDQDGRELIYPRGQMAAAFGNVGFPLEVGQYGLAEFHEQMSPFGWHIIKRIK